MSGVDVKGLSQYSLFKARGEDPASLLSSYFTFNALMLTAAFLSGVQLVGEPIECWCPPEQTDTMCNYTKGVCWVSRQYVIDFDEAIPQNEIERRQAQKGEMMFYPLVPFILILLAGVLKLPSFLWNAFQGEGGLHITKAVRLALSPDQDEDLCAKNVAWEINFNLKKAGREGFQHQRWLAVKQLVSATVLFPLGREIGTYQTGLFLFSRLLAVAVVMLAYPGLSYALQMDFVGWGLFLSTVLNEQEPQMRHFPRETLCDFRVRQLQNVHDYTVQCVLHINMWSEKVFIFLWFWLLVILLASLYSYQYWFRKTLFPHSRLALVNKHLSLQYPGIKRTRRRDIVSFAHRYLSYDSILVIRILEMEAGHRLATLVVGHLWQEYNRSFLKTLPTIDSTPEDPHLTSSV